MKGYIYILHAIINTYRGRLEYLQGFLLTIIVVAQILTDWRQAHVYAEKLMATTMTW